MAPPSLLLRRVHCATLRGGGDPYGAVRSAAVLVARGRVVWVGSEADIPRDARPDEELDGEGRWVTPGLVDCHTHLVFGGNRAREFEERLRGASYEEIARRGGGILSTVRATRAASDDELLEAGAARLRHMISRGVTALEIKSGYGLDVEHELRMLRVARALGEREGIPVRTTLLGAHALPPEFSSHRGAYVDLVCQEMVPRAALEGLADAVDAFCEGIAFTPAECARVLEAGARHGLALRLHADQLSDLGGAALAARHGAVSADHLEHTSEEGARAMAAAGTAAVLLPWGCALSPRTLDAARGGVSALGRSHGGRHGPQPRILPAPGPSPGPPPRVPSLSAHRGGGVGRDDAGRRPRPGVGGGDGDPRGRQAGGPRRLVRGSPLRAGLLDGCLSLLARGARGTLLRGAGA